MRAGAPGVTLSVAVALVSPGDDTVTLALPIEVGVKLEVATPASADTGEAGLNVPDTPLSVKVIALVAVLTVLPLASWMVAL